MRRYNVLPCYRMMTLILTENQRKFIRQFVFVFILDLKEQIQIQIGVLRRANGRTGSSINGARRGTESHNILLMGSSKSSLARERSPF